jgi:PleD family two-component response regulator
MINGARVLAKQLQAGVAALQIPQTQSCVTPLVNLSVSIVSTRPEIEQSPKTLVDEADRLLRLAKQRSSNQILHAFLD